MLDDCEVEGITHYLEPGLAFKDPYSLARIPSESFIGSVPYGDGFILTPQAAKAMIDAEAKNKRVVKPYLIGDDVNGLPPRTVPRWIIDFETMTEAEASDFVSPFRHVQEHVRAFRLGQDPAEYQQMIDFWWQYWRPRQELYRAVSTKKNVIVMALTSKFITATFLPTGFVYDQTLICIPTESWFMFAVLQSWIHAIWAIQFGATMGETFRYNPTRCYQTFPFPESSDTISAIGERCWAGRDSFMSSQHIGITDFYNRFHNRGEQSEDIARLRALHMEMDQAVAAAYGWSNLDLGHGFHATKQGERYTLSESARRTVLDRLLTLNHQRYEEEMKAGVHGKGVKKSKRLKKPQNELVPSRQVNLFK